MSRTCGGCSWSLHGGGLFVLRSIMMFSLLRENVLSDSVVSSLLTPVNAIGSTLMFRWGCPGVHIGQRVSPFAGHDQDRVLVQFRSNQGVHLGHVAAQPEKPTGDRGQYQDALNDPSVGTLRGDNRQCDANHAENGREDDDR